jgi:hypothetical protein
MMVWIQEDTERDYNQREYGKNALVVSDRGDGDILGDADVRGKIAWQTATIYN